MKKILILCLVMIVITGCSQAKEKVESQTNTDSDVANSLGDTYYRIIKRETNVDRNNYYASLGSTKDFQIVGRELEKLSIPHFSTDSHYMAEGQYLKYEDHQQLIRRTNLEVSETTFPHSIQPERGTAIDGIESPVMVSAVYEQDYYLDEKGENLAGVSIGIVIDPGDENNKQLASPMSNDAIRAYGEEIIPKLYTYLKTKKEFKDIPLNICVYQAANKITSYVDGQYILESFSTDQIGEINSLDLKNVFITSDEAATMDSTTPIEFQIFKSTLKKLSVDAVGVVGYASYENGSLVSLEIVTTINVKTYGELGYFVSKSVDVLNSAFSEMFDTKMIVKIDDEVEAIIVKDKGQDAEVIMLY